MLLQLWQWLCENARRLKSLSHISPPFMPLPRVAYCTPLHNKFVILVEEELRNIEIAFPPALPRQCSSLTQATGSGPISTIEHIVFFNLGHILSYLLSLF